MKQSITQQDIMAANIAAMNHFQNVATSALNAVESLAALNLSMTREHYDHASNHSKALLGAKTPQEFAKLTVEKVQPTAEKAVAYSKQVYDISTGAAEEIFNLVKSQFEDAQKSVKEAAEGMLKSSPYGSEVALAAMNQAEAAATKAYANLNDVVSKVKSVAEANIANATKTAKPAARKAAK